MTERKKKLRILQGILLFFGIVVVIFTYTKNPNIQKDNFLSEEKKNDLLTEETKNSDVFYNIEYSGIDLSGNRYILKSEEAINDKINPDLIKMKLVEAIFYFKDGKILKIFSKRGIYNNKTLDMIFEKNIKAYYEESNLFAEKAIYSNSENFLTISENVKIKDVKGTMFADKLYFDITNQTLNISSINDNKINTI